MKNLSMTILSLNLDYHFNQSIDYLPSSIESIFFSEYSNEEDLTSNFNYPIDNLPNSIKYIRFGNKFNHTINNLPDSIFVIEFSETSCFDYEINKLPKLLEHLKFEMEYNNIINLYKYVGDDENINSNMCFEFLSEYPYIEYLPSSVTQLILWNLSSPLNNLSSSITDLSLYVYEYENEYIETIPMSVKILTVNYGFEQNLCDEKYKPILDNLETIYIYDVNQYKLFDKSYHHKIFIKH